jgi:hypothetical protein
MNRTLLWLALPHTLSQMERTLVWIVAILLLSSAAYTADSEGISTWVTLIAMAIVTIPLCTFLAAALARWTRLRSHREISEQVKIVGA